MGCGRDNVSSPGHLPVLSDWVASESWREVSKEKKENQLEQWQRKMAEIGQEVGVDHHPPSQD